MLDNTMKAIKHAKKRRTRRFIQQNWKENRDEQAGSTKKLKIGYWNANRLVGGDKKNSLVELMYEQELDVLCVAESHLRAGNHDDLSMFGEFKIVTRERGYGDKNGGGLLLLIRRGVNHLIWESMDTPFPEMNKEKIWMLFQEEKRKIGVCFVYLAAQSTSNDDFKQWNMRMYASMQDDMRLLATKGVERIVMGDFNGHVGNGEHGIPGNLAGVNSNGVFLQDFIAVNDLSLINADSTRTKGLFTRTAGGFSTILDYVVASRGIDQDIISLVIDEEGDLIDGSDHAALVL